MRRRDDNGRYTFGSLFCGCGGFDLGFIQSGFQCKAAFDVDPLVIDVYRRNLGLVVEQCDLSDPSFKATRLRGIDVLIAGSPCQGFSTAGKRDYEDPRNHLLLTAGHIAAAAAPKVFIAENVQGVIAGGHRQYWDRLHQILKSAGFVTTDICCDASQLGVPQFRKRIVLIAHRIKSSIRVELPTVNGGMVRDAIGTMRGTLNHEPRLLVAGSSLAMIARQIEQGQKLCNVRAGPRSVPTWSIPSAFGRTTRSERRILEALRLLRRQDRIRPIGDADPVARSRLEKGVGHPLNGELVSLVNKGYLRRVGKRYDLTHTFNGKCRRVRWDTPSPTVDTRFGDPRYFLHPDEDRGFTVRQAARIQGFPDTFIFEGPERSQFRMVGNAVPPPMAAILARLSISLIR